MHCLHLCGTLLPLTRLPAMPCSNCVGPPARPAGLPDFTAGWWLPLYNVGRQMTLSVIICLVDICESISIAKAMARVNK